MEEFIKVFCNLTLKSEDTEKRENVKAQCPEIDTIKFHIPPTLNWKEIETLINEAWSPSNVAT